MEISHTLSRREFNQVINHAGDYILNWFQKEINNFSRRKILIREIGNGIYAINNFGVAKTEDNTWTVYQNQEMIHEFNYKAVACFYCLLMLDNELVPARELLQLDYALGSLLTDNEFYKTKIYNLHKNAAKKDILIARYYQNCQRINIIRHRLRKIIDLAKYKKTRKLYEP